ncbi:MAG: glycosyltransferase family 4 protein [candidate division KSB1 bacterium]|nr:glycosyltransferase family 4 protein [candidate division KSB1 bacterium]MDZ7275631.1 glycosyltransferase family 4 protein [candidate division KSB1 bacterium]MDZ7284678.1 glycosyltransferase family 4 protein [candidate division KSB1 bacterium]MDZ7297903.1 glycosyltransferase family 4 protein [candidate division KSB1 bacterium]MDZ7305969.1 glycosyltransferase family 4 protein [candidate division KSB1 bacterium]
MREQRIRLLYFSSFFVAQGGASLSLLKLIEIFNDHRFAAAAVLPREARPQVARLPLAPELTQRITYLTLDRICRRLLNPFYLLRFLGRTMTSVLLLRRLLRQQQIDLVHANDLRDFHAPLAAWSCGIPVVWHLRASRPNPLTRYPVATMMHLLATRIVAVSHCTARQMALRRSFAQNKVTVIYNPGPYRERFHPGVSGAAVRQEFGLPADAPVITLIAKLSRRKGHRVLLQAIPLIRTQFARARFLIVGGELPGHERYARELRHQAEPLVQQGVLIFTGERSDIPQLMAASDVIVQCSIYDDPFPGVVLEAMAIGKVVVAADAGGMPEQIRHGEDGLLFRRGDAEELARRVNQVLADPVLKRKLEQAAVTNLGSRFNFAKFVHEFRSLYETLAAGGSRQPRAAVTTGGAQLPLSQSDKL